VTKLAFKPDHEPLPDNFAVSEGRLKLLQVRLVSKGILNDYDKIFIDYEQNGIIEQVPANEFSSRRSRSGASCSKVG
jgi:hypothetical protein